MTRTAPGHPGERRGQTPEFRWVEAGLAWLTGEEHGAALVPAAPLASLADAALAGLAALAPAGAYASLRGAELLAERAAAYGLRRRGRVAPGGACRLLCARGGWLAANLPRDDDARALAAWLEDDALAAASAPLAEATWRALGERAAGRDRAALVERARLLGLAVAPADPTSGAEPPSDFAHVSARGPAARPREAREAPLVVDLSSLWAGPLAARLLQRAGARVVKVECTRRPDGARAGKDAFYDLLNAGKQSVALDLASVDGRAQLARLLARADIAIESARPRALAQLGVDAEAWVAERPGRVWLSITGYGRAAPARDWVAFGDDAAAAAGLCWRVGAGAPLFVGDAIADPLAGLHGALAALRAWCRGEGALVDVSLCGVTTWAIAQPGAPRPGVARDAPAPRLQEAPRPARPLGADTRAVLAELAARS